MSAEIIVLDEHRPKTLSDEQLNNLIFGPIIEANLGEFDPDKTAESLIRSELDRERE